MKFSTFHASLRRIARSVVGKSFVFLELEDGGSVAKVLPLAFEAVELEWAQAWRGKRRDGRAGDSGLGAALEMTSASRIEKRLRRQEVSASSYTSWVFSGSFRIVLGVELAAVLLVRDRILGGRTVVRAFARLRVLGCD